MKDIFYELTGSIDTREKYEERRLEMAKLVWKKMKSTNSRECRNCHAFQYMDFTTQETRAASGRLTVVVPRSLHAALKSEAE